MGCGRAPLPDGNRPLPLHGRLAPVPDPANTLRRTRTRKRIDHSLPAEEPTKTPTDCLRIAAKDTGSTGHSPRTRSLLHHILACNYYRQQKYPLAQLEWGKACLVDPRQRAYRNNLGAAHFQNSELDQAQECFQESPFNLGLLLYHQQEFQDARDALVRAIHLEPKHAAGYYLLGECLLKLDKVWPAIEEFQKSFILNPHGPAALRALGRTYQLLNRPEEAQRYQEQADEYGPDPVLEPVLEGLDWTQATL